MQRLGKNVGKYLGDTVDIRQILRDIETARSVHVGDVMELPINLDPDLTVMQFVDSVLPMHPQTVFPVAREKQLFGLLVIEDLKKYDRGVWNKTLVRDAMRPVTTEQFVENTATIIEANQLAGANGCGAVGVIDQAGRLVGIVILRTNK